MPMQPTSLNNHHKYSMNKNKIQVQNNMVYERPPKTSSKSQNLFFNSVSMPQQHYYTRTNINGEMLFFDSHGQLLLNPARNPVQITRPFDCLPSSQQNVNRQKQRTYQSNGKTAITTAPHMVQSSISPPNSISTTTTASSNSSSQSTSSDLVTNTNASNGSRVMNGYLSKQPIIDEEETLENGKSSPPNSLTTTTTPNNSNNKK